MIARKSSLIMAETIIQSVLAYVALFFIARYMGPEDYGIIGFAMGFIGLFSLLSDLGFNSAHVKRVSEGQDLGTCIGTFFATKIGLISIMSLATISAVFIWTTIIGKGFESTIHEQAIYIILLYFIFEKLAHMFRQTQVAKTKIAKAQIPLLSATIARTAAIIAVATLGFGPIELAYAYVFGNFILLLSNIVLFRHYPIKRPKKTCLMQYITFATPLIVVSASSIIMSNIDKVLIQLFWSAENVGYYFATNRINSFILMGGTSIGAILFPMISKLHSIDKESQIKKIIHLSERYISMITAPMVFGIVVLAEPAVHILLSDQFYPAIPVFRILPFYALIHSIAIPYGSQLLGMNKPQLQRNRVVIMVVMNFILNIILIPRDIQSLGISLFGLGEIGAAIATVFSYLAGLIYCRIAAYRLIKINFNYAIILHLFAATVMGSVVWWLTEFSQLIIIERWYELLLIGLFGLAIYFSILYLLKEFTKQDLSFFLDTINVNKMLHYIQNELRRE